MYCQKKRKKKRSDLGPMTKAPIRSENKSPETTQRRYQKLRLNNDCGPTKDGQLE